MTPHQLGVGMAAIAVIAMAAWLVADGVSALLVLAGGAVALALGARRRRQA